MTNPSPISGEGGAHLRSGWEGEGIPSRKELHARAKWMRANPTPAEERLWSMLRARRFAHCKFRRQQIVDFYIVDFVSLSAQLIVEADGSQHAENEDDLRRDRYLRGQGFSVLRFWNNDVVRNTDGVLEDILNTIRPDRL